MKIMLMVVGKNHDPSLSEAIGDFTARISRHAPVEWRLIPTQRSVDAEGTAMLDALNDRDFLVLLDEHGIDVDSRGMADLIEKRLNASTQRLVFVIGGAYGISDKLKARATGRYGTRVSLSKLTFPHQLVRLILAEQIYRAFTILRGEKYHHE